jgi:hypothetical protein
LQLPCGVGTAVTHNIERVREISEKIIKYFARDKKNNMVIKSKLK